MKRGFTLIEVLVAASIIFIVASAVVGLTNAIGKNATSASDTAAFIYSAQEGLNIVSKIRDDNIVAGGDATASGGVASHVWFAPAQTPKYGWYKLVGNGTTVPWSLTRLSSVPMTVNTTVAGQSENVLINNTDAHRLICIETYSSVDNSDTSTSVSCNSNGSGGVSSDGNRNIVTPGSCSGDIYCSQTGESLNGNTSTGWKVTINPGNAVKIKSVVVWPVQSSLSGGVTANYKMLALSSVITNWGQPGQAL